MDTPAVKRTFRDMLRPERMPDEPFEQYHNRRRVVNQVVAKRLRLGLLVWASNGEHNGLAADGEIDWKTPPKGTYRKREHGPIGAQRQYSSAATRNRKAQEFQQ